jgi:hypothetical protein
MKEEIRVKGTKRPRKIKKVQRRDLKKKEEGEEYSLIH